MNKLVIVAAICLALSGCAASTDYSQYVAANQAASQAQADAVKSACANPDSHACLAGQIMQGMKSAGNQIAAPKSAVDSLLQAASIFVPAIVQGYGIHSQTQLGITQSNNSTQLGIAQGNVAAAVAESTNNAFVGMAGKIQAPSVPQANVTIGGNGVIGAGTYTSSPITGSYNPTDNSQRNPVDNSVTNTNSNNPVRTCTSSSSPNTTGGQTTGASC